MSAQSTPDELHYEIIHLITEWKLEGKINSLSTNSFEPIQKQLQLGWQYFVTYIQRYSFQQKLKSLV